MASEDKKCTATVIVEYDKNNKTVGPVKIENENDFLKCVKGEAKSGLAPLAPADAKSENKAVIKKGQGEGEEPANTDKSSAEGANSQSNAGTSARGGKRRRKSRRRGKRSGRKSKRRTGKKVKKSKKSKRRSGKRSKSRRRRK